MPGDWQTAMSKMKSPPSLVWGCAARGWVQEVLCALRHVQDSQQIPTSAVLWQPVYRLHQPVWHSAESQYTNLTQIFQHVWSQTLVNIWSHFTSAFSPIGKKKSFVFFWRLKVAFVYVCARLVKTELKKTGVRVCDFTVAELPWWGWHSLFLVQTAFVWRNHIENGEQRACLTGLPLQLYSVCRHEAQDHDPLCRGGPPCECTRSP